MLETSQIRAFNENGFVTVKGIYTEQEMEELEDAFDQTVSFGLRDFTHGEWRQNRPEAKSVEGLHDVQKYHPGWAKLLLSHLPLIEGFVDLMGPNVELHHTKLFRKGTEKGIGFPMHQDAAWMRHEKDSLLAAIVHISDATEEMGCLKVFPGSHKLGHLPIFSEKGRYLDPQQYPISDATPLPAWRGDVVYFHYLTIHGSDINTTGRIRKSVLLQVRDPSDHNIDGRHEGNHAAGMMLAGLRPHPQKR